MIHSAANSRGAYLASFVGSHVPELNPDDGAFAKAGASLDEFILYGLSNSLNGEIPSFYELRDRFYCQLGHYTFIAKGSTNREGRVDITNNRVSPIKKQGINAITRNKLKRQVKKENAIALIFECYSSLFQEFLQGCREDGIVPIEMDRRDAVAR